MLTLEDGIRALHSAGAKITTQRSAIIKCLEGRADHPTAEAIYHELKAKFPTLSIATVYSTMRLLARASAARVLTIDDKRVCFDPDTSPHGHFMCRTCKKIIDIPLDDSFFREQSGAPGISSVTSGEVFLYGCCTECASAVGGSA